MLRFGISPMAASAGIVPGRWLARRQQCPPTRGGAGQGNRTKRGKLPRLGNMPNGLFIERKPRELQALGPFSGTCQNAIILTGQYNNMTLTYVCHRPKAWKLRAFYDAIALWRHLTS